MLKLAVEGNPNFEISDLEIHRGGISYTIDTFLSMKTSVNQNHEISYLIGSDSLLDFKNWKQPKEIIKNVRLLLQFVQGLDQVIFHLVIAWYSICKYSSF